MKKTYTYLILVLVLFSCDILKDDREHVFLHELFKEKHHHEFLYEFEKEITEQNISETITVLKKRLDAYGDNFEVEKYGENGISIKVKAHNLDHERVNKLITNQGRLEFWELYWREDFQIFLDKINDEFITKKTKDSLTVKPLFVNVTSEAYESMPILFKSKAEDTTAVNLMLKRKDLKAYLTSEFGNIKFIWGIPDNNNYHPLYAAKSNKENIPPLTEEFTVKTSVLIGSQEEYCSIAINMNKEGAMRWEKITSNSYRDYSYIGEVINGLVHSVGIADNGPLRRGEAIIGYFTPKEAHDLSIILASQKHIHKLKLLKHTKSKK